MIRPSRKQIRMVVDAELSRLGLNPHLISNRKACEYLGLIPNYVCGNSISASRMLREWACPSDPPKIEAWITKVREDFLRDNEKPRKKAKVKGPKPWRKHHAEHHGNKSDFLNSYEWRAIRMVALKKHDRNDYLYERKSVVCVAAQHLKAER